MYISILFTEVHFYATVFSSHWYCQKFSFWKMYWNIFFTNSWWTEYVSPLYLKIYFYKIIPIVLFKKSLCRVVKTKILYSLTLKNLNVGSKTFWTQFLVSTYILSTSTRIEIVRKLIHISSALHSHFTFQGWRNVKNLGEHNLPPPTLLE